MMEVYKSIHVLKTDYSNNIINVIISYIHACAERNEAINKLSPEKLIVPHGFS